MPFYRLVAVDSRKRRDGRPLEVHHPLCPCSGRSVRQLEGKSKLLSRSLQELGWYDPLKKDTNLNAPAIKKWLDVGAKPSDTVESLLKKAMIMD